MKITESSNKRFYNCFMAVTLFKKCSQRSNKDLKALVSLQSLIDFKLKYLALPFFHTRVNN